MPCRAESPHFAELDAAFDDRVVFLDVFLKQEAPKIARFHEKHPSHLVILRDPEGSALDAYDFRMTPLVVVIGPDGVLRYRGGFASADELRPVIDGCLPEDVASP